MLTFNFTSKTELDLKTQNGYIQNEIYEYFEELEEFNGTSDLQYCDVLEHFEAEIEDKFISSNDLINRNGNLATLLSETIIAVYKRYKLDNHEVLKKVFYSNELNNMVYIKLFNFIKNVDYEYRDEAFVVEFSLDQFDSLISLLNEYVQHDIKLHTVVDKEKMRIDDFNLILDAINLDVEEFYNELNFENSQGIKYGFNDKNFNFNIQLIFTSSKLFNVRSI